jgi:uncharacterized membrane protein
MNEVYELVFNMAGHFCHQMPARSFFVGEAQFPLCIRCTTLLLGGLASIVFLLARLPLPSIRLCILMVLPLMVDIGLTTLGIRDGSNVQRAATGLLFGFFFTIGSLKWLAGHAPTSPSEQATHLTRRSQA